MASPEEYIALFSEDDAVPDMYVAPPLTSSSEVVFLEKLPILRKVLDAYQSIPASPGTRTCFQTPDGYKGVNSWMHGLLHSMSNDSLEFLVENPALAEQLCDNAKRFILLCSGHELGKRYNPHHDASWTLSGRPESSMIAGGDYPGCIISNKVGVVRETHIVPEIATCNPGALKLLAELSCFPEVVFGSDVAERILDLAKSQHPGEIGRENCMYLNPYLSELFCAGFLGLRPLALTKGDGEFPLWRVHFSVHWMPQTYPSPNENRGGPNSRDIEEMLCLSPRYQAHKNMFCEMDALTRQPILEGHESFDEVWDYETAEKMFILLAFRWSVTMALCLAGGVGATEVDILEEWEEALSEYI